VWTQDKREKKKREREPREVRVREKKGKSRSEVKGREKVSRVWTELVLVSLACCM